MRVKSRAESARTMRSSTSQLDANLADTRPPHPAHFLSQSHPTQSHPTQSHPTPSDPAARSINSSAVFLLCAVTLITSIPLFLSGPLLMVKISLTASMWMLCGTSAIGAVLRFAFNAPTVAGYVTALVGQFIISFGQLVTWAGPTRVRVSGRAADVHCALPLADPPARP